VMQDPFPGEYTDPSADNQVRLAHVICTYRREDAVKRKLDLLSPLTSDSYLIIVIDNGGTLDERDAGGVIIIRSPNYGGSAGFARGMIEAVNRGATHILLNDDDAELEVSALLRTFDFLRHLRPEHKDICISGIMLDSGNPNIVYEAGTQVEDGNIIPLKNGIDITDENQVLALSEEERIDYANWTFLCLPLSLVKRHGLPLPVFFREDDVEYGLRLKAKTVTLPGVYVRHPTYTASYRPVNYYYYVRNRLIALCCSGHVDEGILNRFFEEMALEASAYRYLSCEEMILGMEDFLKGPEYVYGLCRQGMHRAPGVVTDELVTLRKGLDLIPQAPEEDFFRRRRGLNGVFKSSAGDLETTPFDMDSAHFYRIGKVLYRTDAENGFIAGRSRRKAVSYAVRITLLRRRAMRALPKLLQEYRGSRDQYSSFKYWERMFGYR